MKIHNDIILEGKDGWLFLFQGGHRQFDYLMGLQNVDEQSAINFSINIEERLNFCKERGIVYKHVAFPSKPLVKTEYLPNKIQPHIQSLFYKFYEPLLSLEGKKVVYYPLNDLKREEELNSTFCKYDTHMSNRAYYLISTYLLGLLNIPENKDLWKVEEKALGGDLCNMLKIPNVNEEEVISLKDTRDIYTIGNRDYLESNTNEVLITHSFEPKAKLRLLIFGDSFFKDLIQYLEPYFLDIMYVRSSKFEYDIVELYKPDIIFTGNAERYFSSVKLDRSNKSFLWGLYGNRFFSPSKEFIDAYSSELAFSNYHDSYENWVKKIRNLTNSITLTKFSVSKDVRVKDSNQYLKFDAVGVDPYLSYHSVNMTAGEKYILCIDMISSIDSVLQVYYVDERHLPYLFKEANSIRKSVCKGANTFKIVLDFNYIGKKLRIDPINAVGSVEIVDIKLLRIE